MIDAACQPLRRTEIALLATRLGPGVHRVVLATVEGEGYISLVDRKKGMIKTGGENVSRFDEAVDRRRTGAR